MSVAPFIKAYEKGDESQLKLYKEMLFKTRKALECCKEAPRTISECVELGCPYVRVDSKCLKQVINDTILVMDFYIPLLQDKEAAYDTLVHQERDRLLF